MRIKSDKAEARRAFALKLFKRGLSVREVNDRLYKRDSYRMNLNRIYKLWNTAKKPKRKKEVSWSL